MFQSAHLWKSIGRSTREESPIKSKTTAAQRNELVAWAKIGVAAAEQIYHGSGRGEEKKQYVVEFLASKGITFDEASINNAIEAAVKQLNTEGLIIE